LDRSNGIDEDLIAGQFERERPGQANDASLAT
jgi:hypothetical protein